MASLTDRSLREGGSVYTVFFWVYTPERIRPCIVKITAAHPNAALRAARESHPNGRGFCFSEGAVHSILRMPPPRPPSPEPPQMAA